MSWRGRLGAEHRLHNNHPNCRPCGRTRREQLPQPARGTETSEQKPWPTGLARSWRPGASPRLFLLTYTSLVTEFQPHGTGWGLPWGPPAGLLLSAEPAFQIELWGRAVRCQGADSSAFPRKTPETYPSDVSKIDRPSFCFCAWSSGLATEPFRVRYRSLVCCSLNSGCVLGSHRLLSSARKAQLWPRPTPSGPL